MQTSSQRTTCFVVSDTPSENQDVPPDKAPAVLSVVGLSVHYAGRAERPAAHDVSFELGRGSVLGLAGESGSGKTSVALAILGLLAPKTSSTRGSVVLGDEELLRSPIRRLRQTWGSELALIPQNPMTALTPVLSIGYQFVQTIRVHQRDCKRGEARQRAAEALAMAGIPDPERILRQYPHNVSGGTAQRIAIAMAFVNRPRVVVADEPTSALDATVQRQILDLMAGEVERHGTSVILISHDFGVIAALSDQICVMYRGRVVEQGDAQSVLSNPAHPYTRALVAAAEGRVEKERPPAGGGQALSGCPYAPRCLLASPECMAAVPGLVDVSSSHRARCLHLGERIGR